MDLLRAAIGITRYLYSLGRFIEGWNVPVARLVISCGLHRITGIIVPPHPPLANGEYPPTDFMPRPYASTSFYLQHHAYSALPHRAPSLRMRSIIVPPPRDEIDLAERTMTFWAAKALDWAASIGWGWSTSMSDDDCSTEWPWGMGGAEVSLFFCFQLDHQRMKLIISRRGHQHMSTSASASETYSIPTVPFT